MVDCLGNTSTAEYPRPDATSRNFSRINLADTGFLKNKNKCNPPLLDLHGISGNCNFLILLIILR